MKGKLLFLGTGGSVGVPMIGCNCEVCQSKDPHNKRWRPSALLRFGQKQFLIDTGPDFRMQAITHGITRLDGLILTHAHHDHTAGFDDLRPLTYRRDAPLPVLLSAETAQDVLTRFYYLFEQSEQNPNKRFQFIVLPGQSGEIMFENALIQYMTYEQGGMQVNGFRFGDMVYLSDIKNYSPSIFDHLEGVKHLVLSALRYTASMLHFSVDDAIDFADKVKAERVWLTHMSHELDYQQTNAYLPSHIRLAYDSLEIEFE